MNSKFDLAAARAGEPVECRGRDKYWEKCHFVGVSESGRPVIQQPTSRNFHQMEPEDLRMSPKKVMVRYRDYVIKSPDGRFYVSSINGDVATTPEMIETHRDFVQWIHLDWKTAEVPQ